MARDRWAAEARSHDSSTWQIMAARCRGKQFLASKVRMMHPAAEGGYGDDRDDHDG